MPASESKSSKSLLVATSVLETATGLGLLAAPSSVVEPLLGTALDTPAEVIFGRVAGAALLALGVWCWLARDGGATGAVKGLIVVLLLYNIGVVAGLLVAWASPGPVGIALWPVVLLHGGLAAWCATRLSKAS